jgi:acyl carrier protein
VKKWIGFLLLYLVKFSLWFRYRVTVKGLENLNPHNLKKTGGMLFLPNHPTVFVDPTLIALAIWKKFPIRPVIVEYMYYAPVVNWIMRFMNALPIPNFVSSSNSLKKKRADQAIEQVMEGLKNRDNFLIYPAGRVKHSAKEVIGGSSAVHRILQFVPQANIVLVRITGLWGSSFSRALTGKTPPMFPTIWRGVKVVLKNFIFFTPRREVTIEFVPAPSDFPYQASRLEMNRYLEKWYNRPDGIINTTEKEPGESLYLVSYSRWKEELPAVEAAKAMNENFEIHKVPSLIQEKIRAKLSEMTELPANQIQPSMDLASDLGLDSLDSAELIVFLEDEFDIAGVPVNEITTVGKVMAIADRQIIFDEQMEEEQQDLSKWNQAFPQGKAFISEGQTLPEVFFKTCERMGKAPACGDMRSGVVTYDQAKLRILLLADYIRQLPGEYIGILLPSSVAAYFTVLACQLAGKVPLMINWTVGPRHIESVVSLSKVQVVLSSWAFLDRLDNVNLTGLEDLIVTLEDVRRQFKLADKLKAFVRSKLSVQKILSLFGADRLSSNDKAVLLFTSGTESMPKGVPLTHGNILSNQRASVEGIELLANDILVGILPPFHAFGFTVSGLLPLVAGIRVAYFADPTDGKGIAKTIEKWRGTIMCGAPTFLKGMFKGAKGNQLKSLRLCVTGAEKAPPELFHSVHQAGHMHLIEGYGITECSPVITVNHQGNPQKGVGTPLSNLEVGILDIDTHQLLPQGKQGLILVRGPSIFSGYLNPGLSSPFVSAGGKEWYSTGDLGYLDEEGNLILSGRLKRFIKMGAEMVSLAAIEEALQKTVAQRAENKEEGPTLAVCAKEETGEKAKIFLFTRFATSVEEVNKLLKEAGFSNLVKISKVQQLPEIPIMGTGKVNYRALEAQIPSLNGCTEVCKTT